VFRDLPAPIAADCINYGLQHSRDISDVGLLLYKNSWQGYWLGPEANVAL